MIQTVFVLLEKDQKFLLIQEGGRAKGLWCLPGGHVDKGETLEEAAVREVKEETSYDGAVTSLISTRVMKGADYLGNLKEDGEQIELNIFRGEVTGGVMSVEGKQELDIGWFSLAEIGKLPLRWKWLPEFLDKNKSNA